MKLERKIVQLILSINLCKSWPLKLFLWVVLDMCLQKMSSGLTVGIVLFVKFFLLFLFIYSLIYIYTDSSVCYYHYFLMLKLSQTWPKRTLSSQFLCPFDKSLHFLNISFLSVQEDVSGFSYIFPSLAPESVIPSKIPSLFQWRMVFRNEDLGIICIR